MARFFISRGMVPDTWLSPMAIMVIVERLAIERGNDPPNLFEFKPRVSNLLQFVRRVIKSRSLIDPLPNLF